jgi:hypothetical protein
MPCLQKRLPPCHAFLLLHARHCRRKAKENNFKPVLESIRDLMNEDVIIPPWLRDIFLGAPQLLLPEGNFITQ